MSHVCAVACGLLIGAAFYQGPFPGTVTLTAALLAGVAGYRTERTP